MITKINIDGKEYEITDEQTIESTEELIFELRSYSDKDTKFVVGCFDDLLGSPIKKVWKILV
jgi:hypothetical protein